jgi:hypothetical protein
MSQSHFETLYPVDPLDGEPWTAARLERFIRELGGNPPNRFGIVNDTDESFHIPSLLVSELKRDALALDEIARILKHGTGSHQVDAATDSFDAIAAAVRRTGREV